MRLAPYLICTVVFQIVMVVYFGCLRGAGDIRYTTVVALCSVIVVRTGVSYLFGNALGMGIAGIWCGVLADQFFRCLLGMLLLRKILPEKQIWLCSIIGAMFHNCGQIAAAVAVMRTFSVAAYLPLLLVSGSLAGLFTGLTAQFLLKRIQPMQKG